MDRQTFNVEEPLVRLLKHKGADRKIQMGHDFIYKDRYGVEWLVPALTTTDGASLKAFKYVPGVGSPLVGDYRIATIFHDHFCDTRERGQKETHEVFREICILHGVPRWKAYLMWAAVRSWNRVKNRRWK
jgi:hypothetical protein